MSSVETTYNSSNNYYAASQADTSSDRVNELSMNDFIKMMIAELENQDPTNPMSNTDMLTQIGQIRAITSNDKLTSSIEALTLGQSLSTASALIGKTITGKNITGEQVTGKVEKVTIENGTTTLIVNGSKVSIGSILSIDN